MTPRFVPASVAFVCLCLSSLTGLTPATAEEALEAIKIELPPEHFSGTPLEYWGPHLEEEDYRDRPPFLAPKGVQVVSRGKAVSASVKEPLVGALTQLTDGEKKPTKRSVVELAAGPQWIQLDLETPHALYALMIWHYYDLKRVYFDVRIEVSNDPAFNEGVTVLYNNDYDNSLGRGLGEDKEYIEDYRGRLVKAPEGALGRYVRLYSNGNTANEMNHYIEVEVFGLPAQK